MLYLVKGPEEFLRERALKGVINSRKNANMVGSAPDSVLEIVAKDYKKGQFTMLLTPTLFGDAPLVVVRKCEECSDDLIDDCVKICEDIASNHLLEGDLVLLHSGAVRGKKMITAITRLANPKAAKVFEANAIKKDSEKHAFVASEFRNYGVTAPNDAINSLIEYAGENLEEMAATIAQISSDSEGKVTKSYVDNFFKSLLQVDVWDIINAATSGNSTQAITLFRHSLQNGEAVASLIPRVAVKLRQFANVSGIQVGAVDAKDVGMQDWQLKNLQREFSRFTTERLISSFTALSDADFASKGGNDDGGIYAFEMALRQISGDFIR